MSAFVYPQRPDLFAWKFTRLMTSISLGHDLGPAVCWLLAVIAHTEEEANYSGPVAISNEELLVLCSLSKTRFYRARQQAVEAGWLRWLPGSNKGNASRYFVTIPAGYALSDRTLQEGGE